LTFHTLNSTCSCCEGISGNTLIWYRDIFGFYRFFFLHWNWCWWWLYRRRIWWVWLIGFLNGLKGWTKGTCGLFVECKVFFLFLQFEFRFIFKVALAIILFTSNLGIFFNCRLHSFSWIVLIPFLKIFWYLIIWFLPSIMIFVIIIFRHL